MEMLVTVTAQFLEKGTSQPLSGEEYMAKLYDKDLVYDDFLGEARPDAEGRAEIIFNPKLAASLDSPFETTPDLYLVLFRGAEQVFRSRILEDIDFANTASFSTVGGLRQDLGTFLV